MIRPSIIQVTREQALTVPCPQGRGCGAPAGKSCRTGSGVPAKPHQARKTEYLRTRTEAVT